MGLKSESNQFGIRPIKVLDQFQIRLNLRLISVANQAEFRLVSLQSQIRLKQCVCLRTDFLHDSLLQFVLNSCVFVQ